MWEKGKKGIDRERAGVEGVGGRGGERERVSEGESRNPCHLFSESQAAMGGKMLYLFCAHALAASTFSSLE